MYGQICTPLRADVTTVLRDDEGIPDSVPVLLFFLSRQA